MASIFYYYVNYFIPVYHYLYLVPKARTHFPLGSGLILLGIQSNAIDLNFLFVVVVVSASCPGSQYRDKQGRDKVGFVP